jgi:hypothetical protein
VALSGVHYDAGQNTVTLTPARKLNLNTPLLLTVNAAGLRDASGRLLDGNGNGQPGGNFTATLSKAGATISPAVEAGRAMTRRQDAVDAVLGSGFRPLAQYQKS